MKKLLDSNWLRSRAVQLMSNTSAKSVIPVQITNQNQSTGVRDWNVFKNFINLRSHFQEFPKFSEHFRRFPKIFENLQKLSEDRFENFRHFPISSEEFRRLPTISEDLKNSKMLDGCFKHFVAISEIFRKLPKTSEDFR